MANAVIGALRVILSADTAEFKRALTDAEKSAEKFGRMIGSTLRKGILSLAAGATAGAAALTALTVSSFGTISAQVDLARRVGASVAAIQTLSYQTEQAGGNSEALAKALGTLNTKLGEAAQKGAGPAYEAIKRLGLSIVELSNSDADERIKMISDAMERLGYSTQEQASVLRALGIKQQELINLFQEGSKAIDDARTELQAWGVLLSDVDAAKVEMAGDAWDKLKMVLVGIGNQIAIRLAPLIQAVADYIGEAAKEAGGFGGVVDAVIGGAVRLFGALQREIYDVRITFDSLIGTFLDGFNKIAEFPPGIIAKILGGTSADYGFEPIKHSFGNLINTLEKPPTDEQWNAWLEEIKKKSEEAAKIAAAAGKPGQLSSGDVSGDAKADKLAEREREKQEQKLAQLQEALMTERELELSNYAQRIADLNSFHDAGLLSDAEYNDLLLRSRADHAKNLAEINEEITRDQMRNFQQQADGWFGVANDIGSALESIFGESKAIAIAQAIINTAQAITRSLAEYGATPLGLAAAAAAAVAGAAQIATITKTTKSSKGGGGGSSSVSSVAASAPSQSSSSSSNGGVNQTLHITGINPNSLYSGEAVRRLAEALVEYQRDGGQVVLGNT